MNILFLTLLYRPEQKEAVAQCSRDGLQNQIDSFQWALIDGEFDDPVLGILACEGETGNTHARQPSRTGPAALSAAGAS